MDDPNDFTTSLATVIGTLEERVRLGVEQPATVSVIYQRSITSYELPPAAVAVTRVTGMRARAFTVFEEGRDYTFGGDRLMWVNAAAPPDEGARLEIEYTFREAPSGLTDFNPGSVAGTLLRAVAREVTLLYAQMQEAYRRAFIDEASGVALDNVVALLGVGRIPALKAKGTVTFGRKRAATQTVVIPAGTRVADPAAHVFATTEPGSIPTEAEEIHAVAGATVRTTNRIAELEGVFHRDDPPAATSLPHAPGFGDDERTITLTAPLPSGELRIRYKPKSVTVGIEALEPGPGGNVNAGTVTLMPTPPPGVDAVTNEDPTEGGQAAESDERLRERAKHELERAGNSTLNAIRFAVLAVKGVEGVEVIDHQTDDTIPLGEVRVRYSGGDVNEVRSAVERTRAAGVIARVEEIVQVSISGTFYLYPADQPPAGQAPPDAADAFVKAAAAAMDALTIGAPLSIRRLSSLAFTIPGLADVAESQLLTHRPMPSSPGAPVTTDPLLVTSSELVRPLRSDLTGVLLAKIEATAVRTVTRGTTYDVDLQIVDQQGRAPVFRAVRIALQVTARATLRANPTQPPVRVGSFIREVQLANSATATLRLTVAADLPDFHPADHLPTVELTLAAAAFPGLEPARRPIDVTA